MCAQIAHLAGSRELVLTIKVVHVVMGDASKVYSVHVQCLVVERCGSVSLVVYGTGFCMDASMKFTHAH